MSIHGIGRIPKIQPEIYKNNLYEYSSFQFLQFFRLLAFKYSRRVWVII